MICIDRLYIYDDSLKHLALPPFMKAGRKEQRICHWHPAVVEQLSTTQAS